MIAALLLLAGQTAPVPPTAAPHAPVTRATSAPEGRSFSILVDPCARMATTPVGNDVIVCGKGANTQRLPLPGERGADGPVAINPNKTGIGAMAAAATPCAALQSGCVGGFGGPLIEAAVSGLATAVSDGIADRRVRAARRRDAGTRVPIPLDDAPVARAR